MPPVTNVQGAAAGRRRMEVVTVMRRSMMRIMRMMVTMSMIMRMRMGMRMGRMSAGEGWSIMGMRMAIKYIKMRMVVIMRIRMRTGKRTETGTAISTRMITTWKSFNKVK